MEKTSSPLTKKQYQSSKQHILFEMARSKSKNKRKSKKKNSKVNIFNFRVEFCNEILNKIIEKKIVRKLNVVEIVVYLNELRLE